MEDIHSFYRERVITMYNTLNHFRNIGIPVETAFWDAISLAHAQIQNGLLYNPMVIRGTAGVHAELSMGLYYNPYQLAYDQIVAENRTGWDARVNLPNLYSGTSYYMFRIQDTFYLVWVNSHGEINQLCGEGWMEEITIPSSDSAATGDTVSTEPQAVSEPQAEVAGDTGGTSGTLYPLPPSLYPS